MIYVLEVQNRKRVKIGFTEGVVCDARIAQLQTGSPYLLKLVLTVDGTLLQEQAIHKALRTALARIRLPAPINEWYPGRHPLLKNVVEALRYSPNHALVYLDKFDPAVKQPGRDRPASTRRQKTPAVVASLTLRGAPPAR